jgi:5-methylcytosine-specific restriction protein A
MPTKAPTTCNRRGCRGLVRAGVCSVCGPLKRATAAEHDERRGSSRERGYDARWERVRAMHLAAEPLCRMCQQAGRISAAVLVDHITPINDGGARLDDDNLQSLCRRCHDQKTADDVRKRGMAG